ncbi:MAG: PRC-barrel domain-containing protein [Methanomassiliicoccales archaeon]|nr:MAG: PRC-barrel domain-containing protein [Methanomassiliicoccales archaeon]
MIIMMTELLEIIGLEVYTSDALYLGNVENIVVDVDSRNIYGIYVRNTNPLLVEESKSVLIPYRWINSVGDMVLLRHFPGYVSVGGGEKVRKLRKLVSERA